MKKLYIILSLLLTCLQLHAIHVVFRFDDPSVVYDSVVMRAVQLFHEKQIPLTIAMVPCDSNEMPILPNNAKDSIYIDALSSENIEIALHGLTHQDINSKGEFGGLDEDESLRRITKGKQILESILNKEITTFIPPFNAWNEYTISAMLQNGINCISADIFTPIYADSIHYFPETLGHLIQQKGMWTAAENAIFDCKAKNAVCVIMFHAYDLPDEQSWQHLEKILDKCIASEEITCHTFQSLVASGVQSSKYRYNANQLHSGLQKYLLHPGVLHTTWLCWALHILNALLYALIPLLLLIGYYKKHQKIYLFAALLGACLFFILALLHITGPFTLLALDIAYIMTMWIGLWLVYKKK